MKLLIQYWDILLSAGIALFFILKLTGAFGKKEHINQSKPANKPHQEGGKKIHTITKKEKIEKQKQHLRNLQDLKGVLNQISEKVKVEEKKIAQTNAGVVIEEPEETLPEHLKADVLNLKKKMPEFKLQQFSDNAANAFEVILDAYAAGNKDLLKQLLDKNTYDGFAKAIDEREKQKSQPVQTLVSVEQSEVINIDLHKNIASIVVKFLSEQINFVRDSAGKVTKGSKNKIENVRDIWTFERDLNGSSPIWQLVGTQKV